LTHEQKEETNLKDGTCDWDGSFIAHWSYFGRKQIWFFLQKTNEMH